MFLVLEEWIYTWYPKASDLGGIPNCAHEPRKQVPLGVMLKNAEKFDTCSKLCN